MTPESEVALHTSSQPVVGLVLAAGAGTRLRPLTFERPKPLCPVGGRALLDHVLDRVAAVVDHVVVNAHHGHEAVVEHLDSRLAGWVGPSGRVVPEPTASDAPVLVSLEAPEALGTAGAVGRLARWIDGRSVLVVNADTFTDADLTGLLDGWDGRSTRVLVHGASEFSPQALVAAALLSPTDVARCPSTPCGLFEVCWGPRWRAGQLEVVRSDGVFHDCGTPQSYLAANLSALGAVKSSQLAVADRWRSADGGSVIGTGAQVHGALDACVVWDGAVVHPGERLTRAVRTTSGRTVLVR